MLPKLKRMATLFARLPGVGEKTALRYVLYLLAADPALAREVGRELASLHDDVRACERCGNFAAVLPEFDTLLCAICTDSRRDPTLLCVVAKVQDLLAIERAAGMRGTYFVLGRLLSPLEGVGPDDVPWQRLVTHVATYSIEEVILATPPSLDGEATALLLKQQLAHSGVRVTRIASGLPHGGDLEYTDAITMGRALQNRNQM